MVNGTVINAEGRVAADVIIEGERIVSVVPRSASAVVPGPDDTVIDAAGCFVIPGGVDAHVHMQLDTGTMVSSDSFESGTIAAAHGGTTTIIDFSEQRLGGQVLTAFEKRFAEAESQCVIDWGLHQVLGGVDAQALIDTRSLVEREGVASIKLFMAYPGRLYSDDGQILRALQMCADTGMMAMVHAENGLAIDVLIEQAVAAGNTGPEFHSLTRPPELEAEAVHRAAVLARVAGNAPLYIVHLSSSHALREVVEARSRGTNIFAETCPQYLHLSLEEHLGQGWPNGAGFICSTPLRSRATAPARLFGLGAKGVLAEGYDADVVIYDPNATSVLSAKTHHMNLDYSAYEGLSVQGGVRTVLSRGEVIVDKGNFLGRVGRGKYLRREISRHIR